MRAVERDIDRVLTLVRHRIREHGFTQLEVQEVAGWGRSYISQLLTRQKSVRVDHVLMILKVIGADPAEFWAEIYQFGAFAGARHPAGHRGRRHAVPLPETEMVTDLRRSRILLEAVVTVLTKNRLITRDEFDDATRKFLQDAGHDSDP